MALPSPPLKYTHFIKGVIVGESGVGKTSFLDKIKNENIAHVPFLSANFATYEVTFLEYYVGLQVWEYYGKFQPKHVNQLGPIVVFAVIDISQKSTLETFQERIIEILNECQNNVWLLLIGNKIDLNREIESQQAKDTLAKIIHPLIVHKKYLETSMINENSAVEPLEYLLPRIIGMELRCFNCFKIDETVTLKEKYLFCKDCAKNPDLDKAAAYSRITK